MAVSRKKISRDIGLFLQQYGKKKEKNDNGPNDRKHDKKILKKLEKMDPVELDKLLRDEEDK